MHEGWDDVDFGGSCGELWDCNLARSGGLLGFPRGGNNADYGSGWVVIEYWSVMKNKSSK